MAVEQYLVVQDQGEWKISFKDRLYGPYDSQQEAIDAAIDCACAMGNIGIDTRVLVQEADRELKTTWSYSLDFHK